MPPCMPKRKIACKRLTIRIAERLQARVTDYEMQLETGGNLAENVQERWSGAVANGITYGDGT